MASSPLLPPNEVRSPSSEDLESGAEPLHAPTIAHETTLSRSVDNGARLRDVAASLGIEEERRPQEAASPSAPAVALAPADYGRLNPFGSRVFYYRQRDNLADKLSDQVFKNAGSQLSSEDLEKVREMSGEGVCQALTLSWIAERLQTSNSPHQRLKVWQDKQFVDTSGAIPTAGDNMSTRQAEKNLLITAKVALLSHAAEQQQSRQSSTRRKELMHGLLGLKSVRGNPAEGLLNPNVGVSPEMDPAREANRDFDEILADASGRLENGQALTFETTIRENGKLAGRHMMGIYRSRQGNLRFFDPDAGEYKISGDPRQFFATYQDVKRNDRNWEYQFVTKTPHPDEFDYFHRAGLFGI